MEISLVHSIGFATVAPSYGSNLEPEVNAATAATRLLSMRPDSARSNAAKMQKKDDSQTVLKRSDVQGDM